ncbi:MAG: PorP/SprF family type IX secretion system membrane protein [Bacteroidales bacterium]|jgi:type IX secretion system PorP/SprF family membrane protein|nr:PorP/SprF family type IX secretion system membrane protein [Bacteroidales bacterium]
MRRIILLIIVLGVMANYSLGQADAHFSLFEYSENAYNPGAAGANNAMCVTSTHRQQWVGYGPDKGAGRPITTLFSFDMPINAINSGIGLGITQDIIGFQTDLYIKLNYAYRLKLDFGTLGLGLGLGAINRQIDPDPGWQTQGSINGGSVYLDPAIPHMGSVIVFDLNFGATLIGDKYWAGLAFTHLTSPKVSFSNEVPSKLPLHIYLMGGYNYSLPNPSFDLLLSGIVQSDRVTRAEFQLNAKLLYNKRFWGGVSYRFTEAIVPMVGLHLVNGISVAYSYDIGLSGIGSYGSHEIMLRYCFDISRSPTPTTSKTVRRL